MDAYDDIAARIERIAALSEKIAAIKAGIAQLPELDRECRAMQKGVIATLERIDVASAGNFGWESRVIAFLCEYRQRCKAGDNK
jgi:hypothetical protein